MHCGLELLSFWGGQSLKMLSTAGTDVEGLEHVLPPNLGVNETASAAITEGLMTVFSFLFALLKNNNFEKGEY